MDSRALNHSPVEVLSQEDIGAHSRRLINKLPNEMLRAILRRVQAHHLIRLRLVNKSWKALIEDICRNKKCLMMMSDLSKYFLSYLSTRFNGHLKLDKDIVFIKPKYNLPKHEIQLSSQLCTFLVNLFPCIEQLYIVDYFYHSSTEINSMLRQWSPTLTTLSLHGLAEDTFTVIEELCNQLNNLSSLKRFNFRVFDSFGLAHTLALAPTFARLEHFSCSGSVTINDIVSYIGAGFSSFANADYSVTKDDITEWLNVPFASIQRLCLRIKDAEVFSFICVKFSSLQMLRIDFTTDNQTECKLTIDMIEHLARLTHLTELRIDGIDINLATLDVTKLVPITNIKIFSLVDFWFDNCDREPYFPEDDRFSQILSIIFPNVQNLTIKSYRYEELENVLEAHVNLFANLRSHDFNRLNDPNIRLVD